MRFIGALSYVGNNRFMIEIYWGNTNLLGKDILSLPGA
jgi:hypothetical protein